MQTSLPSPARAGEAHGRTLRPQTGDQGQGNNQRNERDDLRLRQPKGNDLIGTGKAERESLDAVEREIDEEQQAIGPVSLAQTPEHGKDTQVDDDLVHGHRGVVHAQLRRHRIWASVSKAKRAGGGLAHRVAGDDAGYAPDRLRQHETGSNSVKQAREPPVPPLCQDGHRNQSTEHTAPDRQPALPDVQGPHRVRGVFVRPVIQHVEKARPDQAANDDPQRAVVNLVFLEALAPGLARRQPNAYTDSGDDDQAVPAHYEMADAEDDGINADRYHVTKILSHPQ